MEYINEKTISFFLFSRCGITIKKFLTENDIGGKIVFIPTASIVEKVNFYVNEAKDVFERLGMKLNILELSSVGEGYAKNKILRANYLYISGGNTFFLLQELRKKHLISLLKQRIEQGMCYIGESAGTIILAENLDYMNEMDDRNEKIVLDDVKGVGAIDFYPLVHYGETPFKDITKRIQQRYKTSLSLIPISNSQAIIITNDQVKVASVNSKILISM